MKRENLGEGKPQFKVAYHADYVHPVVDGHRFPMRKYDILYKRLLSGAFEYDFFEPDEVEKSLVIAVHDSNYIEDLYGLRLTRAQERKTGFKVDNQLVKRERIITKGTLQCVDYSLQYGVAMNIAGGTHHAYAAHGEGFCLINDQAVGAQYLLDQFPNYKILVVDLDVHQGNGTASIFRDNPSVFTFSMHGKNNYPMHKERSDLDLHLEDGIQDQEYLWLLETHLDRVWKAVDPDFVFYQCGADVLQSDKLGKLCLTKEGCKKRDMVVMAYARSQEVPLVACMGGGYSEEVALIVEIHQNTFETAAKLFF